MARRVYLHVGVPKSGTTFLQSTMWHNRAELERQGFLYPGDARMDHYHASVDVRRRSTDAPPPDGAWSRLVDQLASWPGDGLISHEFFCMATAEQARRAVAALAPAEVDVVVTARDYLRQFPAVWQEGLKMGSPLGLDDFMDKAMSHALDGAWSWNSQELPAIVERWAAAVPPHRVHLVTVPQQAAPDDGLWERWLRVVGVQDAAFDRSRVFSNQSLGVRQAALLLRVVPHVSGSLGTRPARHRWLRQYFAHEVLASRPDERFGLRPRHESELRARAERDVDALSRMGCAVVGTLDDLVPPPSAPRPHPDDVPDEEIVTVAAQAIEQMIRDVQHLHDRSRRQPGARSGRTARADRTARTLRSALGRLRAVARGRR
jgi:hypothetical protein